MTWEIPELADGYYIYRSQSMNGFYDRIEIINDVNVLLHDDPNVIGINEYYYKISAFRNIKGKALEGNLSEYRYVLVE